VPCRISVFSGQKREKAPRENPPNGDLFVFSHGDFSPRHTKVRHFPCVAFSPTVCRIARGERSPSENPPKSQFGGFSRGDLSPAMQRYDTFLSDVLSPSICRVFAWQGEGSPRENTPQLKCRVFVFHFRSFAWRGARRKHFERHISCCRPFAFRCQCAHVRFLNTHYA